jgi:hypothetical protein
LIIILVFGVLFSTQFVSSQLSIPRHNPNVIPTQPKISQLQVIETVEKHVRSEIPDLQKLKLYFYLYNYTDDRYSADPDYANYLDRIARGGWTFSHVKENPELLNLPLYFVHANGTQCQINSTDGSYQMRCLRAPDISSCAFPKIAEYAVKDRLVFRAESIWYPPANVSQFYSIYEGYHIVDAETGELVWDSIDWERSKRPSPPNIDYEGQDTIAKRLNQRLNPPEVTRVYMQYGASEQPGSTEQKLPVKFFAPNDARGVELLNNEVVWLNQDSVVHTVRSDEDYSNPYTGKFSSDLIEPGTTYEYTFIELGEYPYHCDIHPWMTGKVTIVENFS